MLLAFDYLHRLLKKADTYGNGFPADRVSVLYRNKPFSYFQNIRRYHHSVMKPCMKDHGGDYRNPINGRLAGLFFGVTLYRGDLPDRSPFGDTRVTVPLKEVFDDYANLYFADFYCKPSRTRIHYVTLVLAKSGSYSDDFCRGHLIMLRPYDNIYLRREPYTDTYRSLRRTGINVEVLYTEAIDISNRPISFTAIVGQGHSTPGGIQKTRGCVICNVDVRGREADWDVNRYEKAHGTIVYDIFVNLLRFLWNCLRSLFR
ncbi:phytanoyl-CoA hydroxylase-interacting protein-like isoform X2 [Haliotis asinina]|uniref:phytanoyl-CoA hydroxylase-interacting protein-like isoform X2 n=1 Tax=Haliotis asinina TaxID=109174 RepID=UPI003531A7CE